MVKALALGGVVAVLAAPVAVSAPAQAVEAGAPAGVSIELAAVNGSGCPSSTGDATLSADGESFTTIAPPFFAWAGEQAPATYFRRNCQLSVSIVAPAGWTYAVTQVHSSGDSLLTAGTSGVSQVSIYFQGQSPTLRLTNTFTGPRIGPWQTIDEVELADLAYAPCDAQRNLNINTELRASSDGSGALAFLNRDPVTSYRLSWRRSA